MLRVNGSRHGPADGDPRANPTREGDRSLSPREQLVQLERERQGLLKRQEQLLDETAEGDHTDHQLLTVLHRLRSVAREIERTRAACG